MLELPIVACGAPQACYDDRVSQTQACECGVLAMLRECDSRMAVEDFEMLLNLILGCSAVRVKSEKEGIELLAAMLRHGPASSRKGTFNRWLQARMLDCNAWKVSSQPVQKGRAA